MQSICLFSLVGLAAANTKASMVIDAHGDVVESSYVETGSRETLTFTAATPYGLTFDGSTITAGVDDTSTSVVGHTITAVQHATDGSSWATDGSTSGTATATDGTTTTEDLTTFCSVTSTAADSTTTYHCDGATFTYDDNGTPMTDAQATEAAANSAGQAIVDMENQQMMQQQMDAYLRRKNAQLASVQTRYDQVKAYYAMLDLHSKLVDTLTERFSNLKTLIDERTEIEQRALAAFLAIHNNVDQMNTIYASGQTDTLVPGTTTEFSTMEMVMEQIWGPVLEPDTIYEDNGWTAETLFSEDEIAFRSVFDDCLGTNSLSESDIASNCELNQLFNNLANAHGEGDYDTFSYVISQFTR